MAKIQARELIYKKLFHRDEAECVENQSLSTKNVSLVKTIKETKESFGFLWCNVPEYWKLVHKSGLLWWKEEKIIYDVDFFDDLDLAKKIRYLITWDYHNNVMTKLSILVHMKNYNNAWKEYFAGVDVSEWLEKNFTAEYILQENTLNLEKLLYGVSVVFDTHQSNIPQLWTNGIVSNEDAIWPFLKTLRINEQGSFEITKMFVDNDLLIEFPQELKKNPILHM
jgi:hypothetical protein